MKFNQFGYNVSGPIFIPGKFNSDRSKLFFTWNQEWAKRRQDSTTTQVVPSELMKQGNFSELLGPSFWFSSARIIRDPQNGNAPFAGNIIPTNRLSANGLALLRGMGVERALITCDVDNEGSRRTIRRNGGVLEDVRQGKERYWVDLTG